MFGGDTWVKPGKGGSYSGYVKLRNDNTVKSDRVKAQNQKFRQAVVACKGTRGQAEFRSCVSSKL